MASSRSANDPLQTYLFRQPMSTSASCWGTCSGPPCMWGRTSSSWSCWDRRDTCPIASPSTRTARSCPRSGRRHSTASTRRRRNQARNAGTCPSGGLSAKSKNQNWNHTCALVLLRSTASPPPSLKPSQGYSSKAHRSPPHNSHKIVPVIWPSFYTNMQLCTGTIFDIFTFISKWFLAPSRPFRYKILGFFFLQIRVYYAGPTAVF